MKKQIAIVVLSLVTAFSGVVPANAFPSVSPLKVEAPQNVQKVQWRDRDGGWNLRGRAGPRYYRNGPRYYRGGGYYGRDRYYGNRYYRRGPSAGAIIGGLAAGAIIGGALAQPRYVTPRRYVGGDSHTSWCYSRYRSYRAYDNTFQPNYGPRRQCVSPY